MRNKLIIILLFLFAAVSSASAVEVYFNTGDRALDRKLSRMNAEARYDMQFFIEELSYEYNVPESEIHYMIYKKRMEPADVYMVLEMSEITGRPVHVVEKEYQRSRGRGWGVVVRNLGVNPGSPAYRTYIGGRPGIIEYDRKYKHTRDARRKNHPRGDRRDAARGRGDNRGGPKGNIRNDRNAKPAPDNRGKKGNAKQDNRSNKGKDKDKDKGRGRR
ncbi:MAG: hypothetical protein OEZ13_06465 [Spirochaetia bacterium]|nr:hypothetical protein [Spirochaetia bacterium]